jgi:hypothetical protein
MRIGAAPKAVVASQERVQIGAGQSESFRALHFPAFLTPGFKQNAVGFN